MGKQLRFTTIGDVTTGQGRRPSTDDDCYDGPVIAARTREAGKGWIWVANGTRSSAEVFRAPSPIGALRSPYVALPQVDEAMADAFVDELRSGSWLEEDEPWAEEDSDDESVVETITTEPPAHIDEYIGVEIRILGPVEVVGWSQAPERAIVTELACYLALHPGRIIPGDELRAALWPDSASEASAKSLRTYMSLLRKALGAAHVPAGTGAGYRIGEGVTTDWQRFRVLTAPGASPDDLQEGLELVRGRPFAGVPSNSFGWIYSELLVSEIEVAVVDVNRRLVEAHSAKGDLAHASWAVRRGLLAVPTDFGLWELCLTVAALQGRDELARARRDAEAALGEDATDLAPLVRLDGDA